MPVRPEDPGNQPKLPTLPKVYRDRSGVGGGVIQPAQKTPSGYSSPTLERPQAPPPPPDVGIVADYWNRMHDGSHEIVGDANPFDAIKNRLVQSPLPLIRDYPITMAYLVQSRLPTETLNKLYPGLSQAFQYAAFQNSLSPGDRAIMAVRAKALQIQDPGTRKTVLSVLDDPDVSAAMFSIATGSAPGRKPEFTISSENVKDKTTQLKLAVIQYLSGQSLGEFNITLENPNSLASEILPDTLRLIGAPFEVAGHIASAADKYSLHKVADYFGVTDPLQKAGHLAGVTFNELAGRIEDVSAAPVSLLQGKYGSGTGQFYWPTHAGTALGTSLTAKLNLDPNDPTTANITGGINGLGQLIILGALGKVGQLGAATKAGGVALIGDSEALVAAAAEEGGAAIVSPRLTGATVTEDYFAALKRRYGVIGARVLLSRAKTLDELMTSKEGQGIGKIGYRVIQKTGEKSGAVLTNIFGDPEMGNALSRATSPEEFNTIFSNMARNRHPLADTRLWNELHGVETRLKDVNAELDKVKEGFDNPATQSLLDEEETLAGMRLNLKARLNVPREQLGVFERPRLRGISAKVFKLPYMTGTRWGRTLQWLHNPIVKVGGKALSFPLLPNLSRILDELSVSEQFHMPGSNLYHEVKVKGGDSVFELDTAAMAGARAHNVELIKKYASRAGMKNAEVDAWIQKMLDLPAGNQAEWFRWRSRFGYALARQPLVGGAAAERITRIFAEPSVFDRERMKFPETVTRSDGTTYVDRQPVLAHPQVGDELGGPLSAIDSHMKESLPGVDIRSLIDATSWVKKWLFPAKKVVHGDGRVSFTPKKVYARMPLRIAYQAAHALLESQTAVAKPLQLFAAGLRLPTFILRVMGEQLVRAGKYGHTPGRPYERMFENPDPATLGSVVMENVTKPAGRSTFVTGDLWEMGPDGALHPKEDAWIHLARHYDSLALSQRDIVQMLRRGGPDGWLEWLRQPEHEGILKEMQTRIQGTDAADLETYAKRLWAATKDYSGGHAFIEDALRTGKLHYRTTADLEKVVRSVRDEDLAEEYQRLSDDAANLQKEMQAAREAGDTARVNALAKEFKKANARMGSIEEKGDINRLPVSIHNPERVAKVLQEAYANGDYIPPREVPVETDGARPQADRRSFVNALRDFGNPLYSPGRIAGKIDYKFARNPFYQKAAKEAFLQLRDLGWDKDAAEAAAKVKGAQTTADVFYDLSKRSSTERTVRNIFWYAPVTRELLTTWLWKIPARSYWPVGATVLAGQAKALISMLKSFHVITTDENGKSVIQLPFMATFLSKLTGLSQDELKKFVTINPASLNLVATSPYPTISGPAFGVLAKQIAIDHPGMLRKISELLSPYDPTVSPIGITYLWLAAGGHEPPAWLNALTFNQAKTLHDRMADYGLQVARIEVGPQPQEKNFGHYDKTTKRVELTASEELAYENASKAWAGELVHQARQNAQAMGVISLIGSTLSPAPLHITDQDQRDASKLKAEIYGKLPAGITLGSQKYYDWLATPAGQRWYALRAQQYDSFVQDHPNSAAYLISYNTVGPNAQKLLDQGPDDNFYDQFRLGGTQPLSVEDYALKVIATEAYRLHHNQKAQALLSIGDNAPALLLAGYDRHQVTDESNYEWARWISLNSDAYNVSQKELKKFAALNGDPGPRQTFQQQYLAETLSGIRNAEPYFVDGAGQRVGDYKKIISGLGEALANLSDNSQPSNPISQGIVWYGKNVLTPYFNKTGPLYAKADRLTESGVSPGAIYDQIRRINDSIGHQVGPDGLRYPTPQEMFWGNLSTSEQRIRKLAWATRPVSWLSSFQRQKAGYNLGGATLGGGTLPGGSKLDEFLDKYGALKQSFYDWVTAHPKVSPASNDYQDRKAANIQAQQNLAHQYGDAAETVFNLDQAAPIQRLVTTGEVEGSAWHLLNQQAVTLGNRIQAKGFSTLGWGETSTPLKLWLFSLAQDLRTLGGKYDRGFAEDMKNLSFAMHAKGDEQREGAALYDALFFGNFNAQYIPPAYKSRFAWRGRYPGSGLGGNDQSSGTIHLGG